LVHGEQSGAGAGDVRDPHVVHRCSYRVGEFDLGVVQDQEGADGEVRPGPWDAHVRRRAVDANATDASAQTPGQARRVPLLGWHLRGVTAGERWPWAR